MVALTLRFDLEKDPDEMESLFEWWGYKVHPDYEAVVPQLINQLKALLEQYRDDTGAPIKLWPMSSY